MTDDRRYSRKKPCAECPFGRHTAPGMTGGADPEVYVGQAHGPFWLPCHMAKGYTENKNDPALPQCAGAAMYRNLVGVASQLPEELHRLEGDRELALASPAELLSHHRQCSLGEAERSLLRRPVNYLCLVEMEKVFVLRQGWVGTPKKP